MASAHLTPACARPLRGVLLPRTLCAALWLLIAAVQPSRAQNSVNVGNINIAGVGDLNEVTSKWWFWLIIGLIAAFFVVGGYFVWRGWRQWKLNKKLQQEQDDADSKLGSPGRVHAMALGTNGKNGDVELGMMGAWGVPVPVPGEPLSEAQVEFLKERERRTGVHSKPQW